MGEGPALSYAQALEGVERVAGGLRAAGVGPGERVLVTARTTTEHVLAWLGLMEVGAVQVPVNPSSTPDELAALVAQATPTTVVTDADLRPAVDVAIARAGSTAAVVEVADLLAAPGDGCGPTPVDPDSVAVMIPTSGTTGRSKLVMQTHLAYVMAGEGFPLLVAADRRRPAHDVAAAVPHQRARVLDARVGRCPGKPGAAARRSRPAASSTPPGGTGRPSSTPSAPCSRS